MREADEGSMSAPQEWSGIVASFAAVLLTAISFSTLAESRGATASTFSDQTGVPMSTPSLFPTNAERGRSLATVCLACHGLSDAPVVGAAAIHPPKLVGQRPEVIFKALIAYQSGARRSDVMGPLVAGVPLQNLRDLSAYLAAGGPIRVPKLVGEQTWAHEKVHRDCTSCHGETGMGEMWGIPVLTGQRYEYLVYALNAYRDGTRAEPTMGPIASKLSAEDIHRLATYFSQQTHLRFIP